METHYRFVKAIIMKELLTCKQKLNKEIHSLEIVAEEDMIAI